jgi:hypothetical protein
MLGEDSETLYLWGTAITAPEKGAIVQVGRKEVENILLRGFQPSSLLDRPTYRAETPLI